jgi:hypothetical protein
LGDVPKFSGVHQDWEDFYDQLLFYFEGSGIQNVTQQRAILLSSTFAQNCALFKSRCVPPTCIFVEIENFNNRMQSANEPFANYLTALHKLAKTCQYPDLAASLLRQVLRGMQDKHTKERLLARPYTKLTL